MYQMLQPTVSHLLSLYLMVMAAGLPPDISTNVTLNPALINPQFDSNSPLQSQLRYNPNHDSVLNPIRVLSLNCRSLRSLSKRGKLHAHIEESHANVIIDCESHLDDSFTSTEVFPPNFTTLRKDRKIGGGGVFFCLCNALNVSEQPSIDVDAELIWAKLRFDTRKPLYVCSFYRPPGSDTVPLDQLNESLNRPYSGNNTDSS